MSITMELKEIGPVVRAITATVEAADVNKEFDKAYNTYGKSIRLPGFRKGKIPRGVMEKRFGKEVGAEVAYTLAQRVVDSAIEDHKLEPVDIGEFDRLDAQYGSAWTVNFQVELKPKAELQRWQGLPVERWIVEVNEEEIEKEIERMRGQARSIETLEENGPITDEHLVDLSFTLRSEAHAEPLENKNYLLVMENDGYHKFVADAVRGRFTGETFDAELTVGERFWRNEWANTPVQAHIEIHGLKRYKLPDVNDDFAKDAGFDTVEELRADIRAKLEKSKADHAKNHAWDAAVNALIEANPFPIGPGLVLRQANLELENNFRRYLGRQIPKGFKMPTVDDLGEQAKAGAVKTAERTIRRSLLLEAVAEAAKIEIGADAIDEKLSQFAEESGESLAKVRGEFERSGALEGLTEALREERTLDTILEQAEISAVPWPADHDHAHGHDHDHEHDHDHDHEHDHDHHDHDHDAPQDDTSAAQDEDRE